MVPQPSNGAAATSISAEIEVAGLRHFFEKNGEQVEVLGGVDLSVAPGEFVTIIGPSGCGKSTLLFLVAGFLTPTAGKIEHAGQAVTGPHPSRGTVFQSDAVFPWLTVQRNVEFGPRAKGLPREQRREVANRYIDLVKLTDSAKLYPRQLSGGMRKRVDIARTFANDPSVLLMDESFGSLDVMTKEMLQGELLALWERDRKTALFVTHDIEEAIFLADRVIVMKANPGEILAEHRIDFPRPRRPELRADPAFQRLRQELAGQLSWTGAGVAQETTETG
ncbi:MAG TPA: ABC transporter ATP-binding protein [Solirubrobacterales bacterium]|nr:ABC transporter ATP-binding protein [Solirubrobacterales bacterium]